MACRFCEKFTDVPIETPIDLRQAIVLLKSAIRMSILLAVGRGSTSDPFNALHEDTPWPDSFVNHFKCAC